MIRVFGSGFDDTEAKIRGRCRTFCMGVCAGKYKVLYVHVYFFIFILRKGAPGYKHSFIVYINGRRHL